MEHQRHKVIKRVLTAASMLAGDSSFGLDSMDITDINMVSTVCTGDQRSLAFS
jgi:hypothetical protein